MKKLNLSLLEQKILERSNNLDVTRRRRTTVIITGIGVACIMAWAGLIKEAWHVVLLASLLYIAFTVLEKVLYANVVLVYKGLIQKLRHRIEELEPRDSEQGAQADSE